MIPHSEIEYYFKLLSVVLSSQEYLRLVFKQRYKTETGSDWIDEISSIKAFFNGPGNRIYKNAQKNEKQKLDSITVSEWDMTLLSLALRNFGCSVKYKSEDSAVKSLKDMRNYLCHHTTMKVTKEEYLAKIQVYSESLETLGMERLQIEKTIEEAGIISSLEALKHMKILFDKAEMFLKDGKLSDAENCYNEAINTPSLLEVNKATAYEKRAEFLLSTIKNPISDINICKSAMQDVLEALKLNDASWTAYYLAAKCHRLQNELDNAIDNYETALAISPSQQQVRNDLNSCKVLSGIHYREDHRNPAIMPISLKDRIKISKSELERNMTEEEYINLHENIIGSLIPGQDHVFRGHKYFMGWTVPQDYTIAVKHYSSAAKAKNAEGMYNLAMCYHYGYGVEKDLDEALKIYKETANMDCKTPGSRTTSNCNVGVASAQHDLGLLYENGIGVESDFVEAAFWYGEAMNNGMANAANNLGILFSEGCGVRRDMKMAETCWKEAVALGDINASASLMTYYIREMEPELARKMLINGRQLGNSILKSMSNDEFENLVKKVTNDRKELESKILSFESYKNLDATGLTFKQRFKRAVSSLDQNIGKVIEISENSGRGFEDFGRCPRPLTEEMILEIEKRAVSGSVTAENILKTLQAFIKLSDTIDSTNDLSENSKDLEILDNLYECLTQEHQVVPIGFYVNHLKPILQKLFRTKCDKEGDLDMKTRLCYVVVNLRESKYSKDNEAIKILEEGVLRYPENLHYYDVLSSFLIHKKDCETAIKYSEEGLRLFPNNPELLYALALAHYWIDENGEKYRESIKTLKKFINEAPYDHRKVPEAYYHICSLYFHEYNYSEMSDHALEMVERNFEHGLEAEKHQLPCYLPYGESDSKIVAAAVVESCRIKRNPLKTEILSIQENVRAQAPEIQSNFLELPTRNELIVQHRENMQNPCNCWLPELHSVYQQNTAKTMYSVKPITLSEMTCTSDFIFEDSVLDLTIIEDHFVHKNFTILIAEDMNKELIRVCIEINEGNLDRRKMFGFGCRVAVINPYIVVRGNNEKRVIWINEPRCIVYLERKNVMCRYCGKEYSTFQCRKCKRKYCSLECKNYDRDNLKHKIICSIKY